MVDIKINVQVLSEILRDLKIIRKRLNQINDVKKSDNFVEKKVCEEVVEYSKKEVDLSILEDIQKEIEDLREDIEDLDDRELRPEFVKEIKKISKEHGQVFKSKDEFMNYLDSL